MASLIANARMYSVSAEVAVLWRSLLSALIARASLPITLIEHAEPLPIEDLWRRPDMGAVFMCGLPFACAAARPAEARPADAWPVKASPVEAQPVLVAAPVPSPVEFGGAARYWSEFVVRADSAHDSVASAFGQRIAFTVPDSQSGCIAALSYFQSLDSTSAGHGPLFAEIIAPTVTPLGALGAVIRGAADIAPIDSYALALLRRYRPDLAAQVRSVGRTAPTPIPPIVASRALTSGGAVAGDFEALASAFLNADSDLQLGSLMEGLLLKRFSRPDPATYEMLRERFAAAVRFWSVRPLAAITHPAFVLSKDV